MIKTDLVEFQQEIWRHLMLHQIYYKVLSTVLISFHCCRQQKFLLSGGLRKYSPRLHVNHRSVVKIRIINHLLVIELISRCQWMADFVRLSSTYWNQSPTGNIYKYEYITYSDCCISLWPNFHPIKLIFSLKWVTFSYPWFKNIDFHLCCVDQIAGFSKNKRIIMVLIPFIV